tara:strand:+ start:32665 stop:32940 length:276 start_codon:yes stop_codon:yes gene_type:complete
METLSVRYEDDFIHDMEKVMKENRYATKAEFIREAIRDKMHDLETKAALKRLEAAYGAGAHKKRKITDADMRRAKEKAFEEVAKKLGVDLD